MFIRVVKCQEQFNFESLQADDFCGLEKQKKRYIPPGATAGHFQMLPVPRVGHCVPRVDPRAFDAWFRNRGVSHVFMIEAFIDQDSTWTTLQIS